MSRIVSVWLPRWPILRFLAAQARDPLKSIDPEQPFVLAVEASGGPHIAALNVAAEAEGLAVGDPLADARAKAGMLQVRAVDPAADDAALRRLALWATRYTPAVSPWGEESGADGFFLDVGGSAHLFGGEEMLLADLSRRLDRFGLPVRLAIADTSGMAWALSRFHLASSTVLPSGQEIEALVPLPIEALRLSPETCATLRRLGFKRVGALIDKPRAPFAARFPAELLTRLDQALGRAAEPLPTIALPPVYHSLHYLLEPVGTQEAVVAIATRLMKNLVHVLVRDGVGARTLRLALYRVDGDVAMVDIGLAMPTRSDAHVARLIGLKLDRIAETVDAGFGFEAIGLAVTTTERMTPQQTDLAASEDTGTAERCAALIDSLRQRLGPRSVRRLKPIASHLPERAEVPCAATGEAPVWPMPEEAQPRPLLLFPRAEPADVMALVPEGPPQCFRWRGVMYGVAHAQGPERIASEWWRDRTLEPTRDYYLVEDNTGRRFWLYREGLYGRETASSHWFVHGLFA
jgi:protein ImuB